MQIRKMTPDSASDFYRLSEAFYGSSATKREYDQKLAEQTFKQVISRSGNLWGYFIVDSATQQIAGYSLITSYWCHEEGGKVLILDELFIDNNFRHKHFAKDFMLWIEEKFASTAVALTLEVLSTNIIAKDLYVKDGFFEDGFVTMSKTIKKYST